MPLFRGTRYPLLFGGREYYKSVLATGPITYWPQWEPSGGVSRCLVDSAQNGAYTGATLGQPGIGDGRTSPFFDGANDFNNIHTAAFQGRFNGSEGTVMGWARVANAGVWTDGAVRIVLNLGVDANNFVQIQRRAVNNELRLVVRSGGGVTIGVNHVSTSLEWMALAMTWIRPGVGMSAFYNGVQTGVAQVISNAWVGNLAANTTNIGCADNTIPSFVWHGYLAHGAVWGRALPPAEIARLYNEAFR